jgi:hypothetical protein
MPTELIALISSVSVLILTAAAFLIKRALQNAHQPPQLATGNAAAQHGYAPPPPPQRQRTASDAGDSGQWQVTTGTWTMPPPAHFTAPIDRTTDQVLLKSLEPITKMIDAMGTRLERQVSCTEERLVDRMNESQAESSRRFKALEDGMSALRERMVATETIVSERTKRLSPPRLNRSGD